MTDDDNPQIAPAMLATAEGAKKNPDDLTVNQLVWIFADLSAVGNEYRQNEARETLAKYGLTAQSAHRLLREKRKQRRPRR